MISANDALACYSATGGDQKIQMRKKKADQELKTIELPMPSQCLTGLLLAEF
jgi:hypothetical protein